MCLPCHFSDRTASRGRAARFSSAARHRARHAAGGRAGGSLWRGRNLWATNHSENGDGTYGQMMEKWWKTDGQKWWTIENNMILYYSLFLCFFTWPAANRPWVIGKCFKQDESRRSLLSFALALGCFGGISDSFCSFQLLGIRIFRACSVQIESGKP